MYVVCASILFLAGNIKIFSGAIKLDLGPSSVFSEHLGVMLLTPRRTLMCSLSATPRVAPDVCIYPSTLVPTGVPHTYTQ